MKFFSTYVHACLDRLVQSDYQIILPCKFLSKEILFWYLPKRQEKKLELVKFSRIIEKYLVKIPHVTLILEILVKI